MGAKLFGVVSVASFAVLAGASYLVVAAPPNLLDRIAAAYIAERQAFQPTGAQIAQDVPAAGQTAEYGAAMPSKAGNTVVKSDLKPGQIRPLQPAPTAVPSQLPGGSIATQAAERPPPQRHGPVASPLNGSPPSGQSQSGLRNIQPFQLAKSLARSEPSGDTLAGDAAQHQPVQQAQNQPVQQAESQPIQQAQSQAVQMAQTAAPAPAPAAGGSRPVMPDALKMMILIRSTVLALNEANRTNNYSVLHQLGSPGFQLGNSPEGLSKIFAAMRGRNLDLGPVAVITPKLYRDPSFDERGRLRLTGFFPSRPEQVNFDLAFEMVDGHWRLFGIGVNTSREVPAAGIGGQPTVQ